MLVNKSAPFARTLTAGAPTTAWMNLTLAVWLFWGYKLLSATKTVVSRLVKLALLVPKTTKVPWVPFVDERTPKESNRGKSNGIGMENDSSDLHSDGGLVLNHNSGVGSSSLKGNAGEFEDLLSEEIPSGI